MADETTPATRDAEVTDNAERSRFELRIGDKVAYSDYQHVGQAVMISHTEVPQGLEGQGVGGALVRGTLERLRARGLAVIPICPFVAAYIRKHPEYRELVPPKQRAALGI